MRWLDHDPVAFALLLIALGSLNSWYGASESGKMFFQSQKAAFVLALLFAAIFIAVLKTQMQVF